MAKGYNIYTGVERTPSSLAWLVAKRMHLAGEIKRLRKLLAEGPAEIDRLAAKLAALDETIRMHEIPVDPDSLPPRQRRVKKLKLPHGALVTVIWTVLRESGNQPLPTNRFVQAVIFEHQIPVDKEIMRALRRMVINALNDLVRKGRLVPLHPKATNQEGSWILSSDGELKAPRPMSSLRVSEPPAGEP
jgi:hypothetical protein